MTETKHTPGPWYAETDEFDVADVISAEGWLVAENAGTNAHLIAAAPELLVALENLTIAVGMGWDLDGVLEASRAAIAKARGEVK